MELTLYNGLIGDEMFTLDIITLNLIIRLYNQIFPWSSNDFYGTGMYFKLIISLFVSQQCLNIIYDYRVKKAKKKSGESAK